jgi:hypothetical protein
MQHLAHVSIARNHQNFTSWWTSGGQSLWESYAPGVEDDDFYLPLEHLEDLTNRAAEIGPHPLSIKVVVGVY